MPDLSFPVFHKYWPPEARDGAAIRQAIIRILNARGVTSWDSIVATPIMGGTSGQVSYLQVEVTGANRRVAVTHEDVADELGARR